MTAEVPIAQLASDQWGLITRRQAIDLGIPQSRIARWTENGRLLRVAHGVYRIAGAPLPDHLDLRAAWFQLAPQTPAWQRKPEQGVVSHRSAAELYGYGHLPADRHEFTLPTRLQSRRSDVRIHIRRGGDLDSMVLRGLPVTRPSRIASDLLLDREDPGAVAQVMTDALRADADHATSFVVALAPRAAGLGFRRGDGTAVFSWLLDLSGGHDANRWLEEANTTVTQIE